MNLVYKIYNNVDKTPAGTDGSMASRGCVYVREGYRRGSALLRASVFDPLKRRWMAVVDMVQVVFLQVCHR